MPAAEFSYIAFNTYLPALSDPRVRVAFNMAIDKDLLAETVYLGEATPNHAQNLSEGMLGYNPDLEPILSDTLGAIVFQDQVIQVAMTLAGFPAGEAEGLRRAMSRKRSEEALSAYGERFVAGAIGP